MAINYTAKSAELSECGQHRFMLRREWDARLTPCAFIGLNPSTADADLDDPTIRRCVNFAATWGYGSLLMFNLIPYRATKPADMWDWIGNSASGELLRALNKNYQTMDQFAPQCGIVIAAWGAHAEAMDVSPVLEIFRGKLHCLSLTKGGHPGHPLYLKSDLKPIGFGLTLESVNG